MKSDFHKITYIALVTADVVFNRPLTVEEAKRAFKRGDFEDIVDSEELDVESVEEAEPIGDVEYDDDD